MQQDVHALGKARFLVVFLIFVLLQYFSSEFILVLSFFYIYCAHQPTLSFYKTTLPNQSGAIWIGKTCPEYIHYVIFLTYIKEAEQKKICKKERRMLYWSQCQCNLISAQCGHNQLNNKSQENSHIHCSSCTSAQGHITVMRKMQSEIMVSNYVSEA